MAYGGSCPECLRKDNLTVPLHFYGNTNTCLQCGYQRIYTKKGWQIKERVKKNEKTIPITD